MIDENQIQILVARAKRQDQDAFGQLYDALSKPIFNFLMSKVQHKETAEDLLHTVFLKTWKNIHTYKPQASAKFSTWLYQIANYTLIDYWRTRKTTVDLDAVENLSQFAQDPKFYEKYDYLYEAMAQLPLPYQTVIDLRFKQDLSISETAAAMDKSEIGIRVLQHRALKALREKLKNYL